MTYNWLFIAMSHWHLEQKEQAAAWYEKPLVWKSKHPDDFQVRSHLPVFFAEATDLMGDANVKPPAKVDEPSSDDKEKVEVEK